MGRILWTPPVHASWKTRSSISSDLVLLCGLLCSVSRMWYLAATSVIVDGNVKMVELPVWRDSMFHFVVSSLTTCRGSHSPVPLLDVKIKKQWKDQRRVDLVWKVTPWFCVHFVHYSVHVQFCDLPTARGIYNLCVYSCVSWCQPALGAAPMIIPKSLGNVWRLVLYMKFGRICYILYSYEAWKKSYL